MAKKNPTWTWKIKPTQKHSIRKLSPTEVSELESFIVKMIQAHIISEPLISFLLNLYLSWNFELAEHLKARVMELSNYTLIYPVFPDQNSKDLEIYVEYLFLSRLYAKRLGIPNWDIMTILKFY